MQVRGGAALSHGAGGPIVDFYLKEECSGPDVLEIGNLVLQHFYFTAINVDISDGDLRVGFQLPQKLPEPNQIGLGWCLDHAPIVGRALLKEKELSTPNKRVQLFLHNAVSIASQKLLPELRANRLQN